MAKLSANVLNSSTARNYAKRSFLTLNVTCLGWCVLQLLKGACLKMIEMDNQIKVGEVYCSQKHNSSVKLQFNIEKEQEKMKVAKHVIFDSC